MSEIMTIGGIDQQFSTQLNAAYNSTIPQLDYSTFGLTDPNAPANAAPVAASAPNPGSGTQAVGGYSAIGFIPDTQVVIPPITYPVTNPTSASLNTQPVSAAATGGGAAAAAVARPASVPKTAAAKPAATKATSTAAAAKAAPLTVTVKSGDNLTQIAAAHGTTWQKVYAANKKVVGADPNLILPGQRLVIPGQTVPVKPTAAAKTAVGGAAAATAAKPTPASTSTPSSTSSTPVTAGGASGLPAVERKKLETQLKQVQTTYDQGQRLISQFYGKLQYAKSDETRTTINQGIDQTMRDQEQVLQLRNALRQKLGLDAPSADTMTNFLNGQY